MCLYVCSVTCCVLLTQKRGDVVVEVISVAGLVKLQIDVRAEVVFGTEHLQPLIKTERVSLGGRLKHIIVGDRAASGVSTFMELNLVGV